MSEIFDWPLRKVIEASAADAPRPGGGSVSAMVGCFGVAMISMVGNLTVGKEKYRDVEAQTEKILERTKQLLGRLEELVSADMDAFNNFMKVLRMPKDTQEDKAATSRLMQQALTKATDTPLEIARVCLQGLELAHDLSSIGNKGAISDVGVGAYVCEAALNSVLLSVDINVPSIKDTAYVEKVLEEKKQLIAKAQELRAEAVAEVRARM